MATQQFLAKAYLAYFGRPVDPIGAFAFKDATETEVFEAFYASPESQALYGTGFGEAQITAIYQMLFNRDPEPAGLAYWLNQVTLGLLTPAGAALGILNGARNQDAVAVANKIAASGLFTASLDTLSEVNAYVGDAAAAHAREFLKGVGVLPATQGQVDTEISELMDINGPGVHGAPNVFTLTEAVVGQKVIAPEMERVIMWGYNPHAHDETSGVDNLDGNDPSGNDNNLTNEGPEDGGVPIEVLYEYIQTVANLDLVQLGLINVANGEDNESTQLFADVTGMDIVNNGDGTQTISVTLSDGTVNTAEVSISQQFFDLIHGWLFDEEGNSRIYETVRAVDVNDVGSTVDVLAPIVLTSFENNGGTVERNADGAGPVTTSGDDLIVAGRLELLHGAYIDGGAGYNTLEVDAKGTYAQPLALTRIQEVVVQNLPNVYTTYYGSGDGYLDNSTYPDLSMGSGSDDSVLDLSRAVDIQRLVITEGSDTGRDLGELTIVGVRNNATARFEGAFTEDVNLHYGEGLDGPLTVELVIGMITANLNFAHNTDALNLVSLGGAVNSFGSEDLGGRLSTLTISGDAALYIRGDLDDSFQDDSPILIDASTNTKGVSLELSDSQNVTFKGSLGNDVFMVGTDENSWSPDNDSSVTIVGGPGNNRYEVDYTYTATITNSGNGNNNYEVDAAVTSITAGNGANDLEISANRLTVTLGSGNNSIEAVISALSSTTNPSDSKDEAGSAIIVLGDGKNNVDVDGGTTSTVSVTAGNGGNTIDVQASSITVTTGTGKDTIKAEGSSITITSGGGADAITIVGTSTDYVPDSNGSLIKLTVGADATVNLGASSTEFPGQGTITAHQDSFITGTNVKLVVNTTADLQAATLTGVTKVVLDDDVLTGTASNGANDGGEHAMLTLTSTQFKAIGAANFSVDGSIFSTHAYIKIIVDATTSLTDLGVDGLSRNIDLYFELKDGVTLTTTAQQLHEHVAQNGITLANDSNTDVVSGKVVITGGGLNFDPFNTSDTVSSVIGGNIYYGGSLSDDFMVGGKWYNVQVKSVVNGYDRPADEEAEVVLTLDSTGTLPLTQAGFTTSVHNNLEIIGDQDITFTGDINLGEGFTIDFSELEGSVTNMTIAQFQDVEQIRGNGDATVYVKLENKNNASTEMSDPNGSGATGAEGDNPTVGEAGVDKGLVSSGVAKYIVTDIVDDTGSPETGVIYLCDNTEDLEVIGLRANYSATLEINQVAWGINFELQGGSTAKADGPTGTSNVGKLDATYEFDKADAVVTLTHSVAGDTREIKAYGIEINNADSITVNVTEGDATIDMIAGNSLNELMFSSANDITVGGTLPTAVTTIDASDVDGSFEASINPADDFSFTGGAGGSDLTFVGSDFAATDATSIDGGTGGVALTIDDGLEVELEEASLTNVTSVALGDLAHVTLTMEQADDIGAANFSAPDAGATLHLVGLNDQLFALANYDEDLTITLTLANEPEVHLHADTDLTGITTLNVPEGTTLFLTMAQFQQLEGDGDIDGEGSVVITDVTQADVGAAGEDLDMDDVDLSGTDSTITLVLAESVDLSDADIYSDWNNEARLDRIEFGNDMTLTLGDIQDADGVAIVGGTNSTLKFTDTDTDPFESTDASGFDVTTLMFLNTLTNGGNRNVDDIFEGIAGKDIAKVVYNGQGWVQEVDQVVSITAGTTVLDSLTFNPVQDDVELQTFTINLLGGTEISGNLRLSTDDKQDDNGNDLIRTYLQTVTINSTGTAANLLSGETANVITGDITPVSFIGGQTNNLLNVVINASQDFVLEGDVVFASNVGGDGDSISANDIEDAVAVVTVTGAADVTLGGVDLSDGDVDGLNVINNGTGTVAVTIDAADAAEDLSFTGTGDVELTTEGAVDLSDDDLSAVTQITINDGSTLTLTQAQLQALGAGNVVDGENTGGATLNLVEFGSDAFDATALDGDITVGSITLVDADVTLNAATNLTDVGRIYVQEGRTLTLTAAQFQQLAGDGTITGADTDGDTILEAFNIVITGLTQADVDAGFDLGAVDVNGGNITITLGETSVTLGELDTDGSLVAGTDSNVFSDDGVQAAFNLTDGQELRVVNPMQADGLDVNGTGDTTLTFWFDVVDFWLPGGSFDGAADPLFADAGADGIDASGFDVTTLKTLNTSVNNLNVETLLVDLASEVELRVYHDPAEIGYVTSVNRVVFIEEGVTVPGFMVFNDYQDDSEVRTLTLTLDGGTRIEGNLRLSTVDKPAPLTALHFGSLVINSQGTAENRDDALQGDPGNTENVITGSILAEGIGAPSIDNTLVNVTINGTQDFVVEGDIVFTSIDDDRTEATLTINNTASVTVQQLVVSDADADGNGSDESFFIDTLNIVNNGGPLTVTGASPAIDADGIETINFSGTGDITLGDADGTTLMTGISSDTLSVIDASGLSGDLSLGEVIDVDSAAFTFTSGSGVTTMTMTSDTLDSVTPNPDSAGWTFDFTDADAGSELHLDSSLTLVAGSKLTITMGPDGTLFIDGDAGDVVNLSTLDLDLTATQAIVLGDEVELILTAAQADGLTIVAGTDENTVGTLGVVNIVDLGDTAVDLSGIAANIAGTVTLEDNDVTVALATDLGDFSVTLTEIADTSASLAGQTIRFQTVAQAERDIIVDEAVVDNGDSSTNVVWLFTSITNPAGVDTSGYDAALGRLWVSDTLINNEGGLVESLFTTLPSSILRVDFNSLTDLNILLNSSAVDRVMEFSNFTTVGNLTFDDIGISPVEHLSSLDLWLGGEVTIGNIAVADVVGAPGYNPAAVTFNGITINSFRAVQTGDLLASEGFVNDNDGLDETKALADLDPLTVGNQVDGTLTGNEHTQPINMNTVGNLGVGADNGLDLLFVYVDTHGVTSVPNDGVDGGGVAGDGAALTVGTITYESDVAVSTALLDITGDNNITIAAINTADADITIFNIDATGFTAILDPVMHLDNTETMTIVNDGGAPEGPGAGDDGTVILQEVEGNELSTLNASGYDGDLNVTFSQIDSNDDGGSDAFTFTAGTGVSTVVVAQVGANVPTLAAGSTWNFNLLGGAAGSTLTLDDTVSLAAGSFLNVTLDGNSELIIDGALNLSAVNLTVTGGRIFVPAGQSLTLSVAQALALTVDVEGSGTVIITGNADDANGATLGENLKTVGVNVAGVTLTALDGALDAAGDEVLELTLTGGVDDADAAAGQSVVGSPNVDALTTANDHSNTLNGMGGNDTLTGGDDTVTLPDDTFNTYVVASGTDTIVGLKGDGTVSDVITASGGATVLAEVGDDGFVATAGTTNTGATVELTVVNTALGLDNTVDMTLAGGTSGYTITGSNFQTLGVDDDGNDLLVGSAQSDILNGGNWEQESSDQVDTLTGNGGNDRFEFNTSVSSAATLGVATTTAGVDREEITITADDVDNADETLTVNFTVNGIADQAAVALGALVSTDLTAITSAVITALDAKAGISATAGAAGVVVVTGDNAGSVTITSVVAGGTTGTLAGAIANGTDVVQVTTLTVSGTPTAGDYYSIQAALVVGGGDTADATADGTPTTDEIATGIEATFNDASGVAAAVVASVITFTDSNADDGGFVLTTDTTAAFAGSGASDNGADDYLTADVITDFVSGQDSISFGLAAGVSGGNYFEAAAVATYATALVNADNAFDGTVQYYLTSATDLDGVATIGLVNGAEGAGLLFVDANLDGNADLVVLMTGVTLANFNALDIVA